MYFWYIFSLRKSETDSFIVSGDTSSLIVDKVLFTGSGIIIASRLRGIV